MSQLTQIENDIKYINKYFRDKEIFKNKKILITGSNGFISYTLQNYLIFYQNKLKFKKKTESLKFIIKKKKRSFIKFSNK
jgi:hypothetical protein